MITESYPTASVPVSSSFTTIATAPVKANAIYLITFSFDYVSASGENNVRTFDRIRFVPSSGTEVTVALVQNDNGLYNGGGVSMSAIYIPTSDGEIKGQARHWSSSNKSVGNVNFKVYRLE